MNKLIVNTKSGKVRVMGTKKEAEEFAKLVKGILVKFKGEVRFRRIKLFKERK